LRSAKSGLLGENLGGTAEAHDSHQSELRAHREEQAAVH
jgi:hypothetical protein